MKSKKIVVAEDDVSSRHLVCSALKKSGYEVIGASDGQRALNILEDNSDVGVIITDVVMPEVGGKQLIRQVLSDTKTKHVPIIVISGAVKLNEINYFLDAGARYFLPKPIELKSLLQYVENCLDTDEQNDKENSQLNRPSA